MSELPPIPEAEFSPPWHQFFVKLREFISVFTTDTNTRLDAIETIQADNAAAAENEEEIPIGTIMLLGIVDSVTLAANEKTVMQGNQLQLPFFYINNGGTTRWRDTISPPGAWQLIGPATTAVTTKPASTYQSHAIFKRIT